MRAGRRRANSSRADARSAPIAAASATAPIALVYRGGLEDVVDTTPQPGEVERIGHDTHGAERTKALDLLFTRRGREENDRNRSGVGRIAQRRKRRRPVHARH